MRITFTLRKLMAAAVLVTAFTAGAMAQNSPQKQAKATPTTVTYQIAEPVKQQADNTDPSYNKEQQVAAGNYPWYNYKGIADLADAKAEWVKDNPEAYHKLLEKNSAAVPHGK